MSEKAAKATRRDLRRVVSRDAGSILNNHGATIRSQGTQIANIANELQSFRDIVKANVLNVATAGIERVDERTEPLRRGFTGRLRWLLTGK